MKTIKQLPSKESMEEFLEGDEIIRIYLGLQLLEQSFVGDTDAGVHAMLHDPGLLEEKLHKYIRLNIKSLLIREVIWITPAFSLLALMLYHLINGEPLLVLTFVALVGAIFFLSLTIKRCKSFLAMRDTVLSIYESLDSPPLGLNHQRFRKFLKRNPDLQAYAATFGQQDVLLNKDLVALKHRELQLLGDM